MPHSHSDTSRRPPGRFWQAERERVRVKICGVKNIETALACAAHGADAIGIHAVPATQSLERLEDWQRWLAAVPSAISIFLLTDTSDLLLLERLTALSSCDTIQLQAQHEPENVHRVAQWLRPRGYKLVKSLGVTELDEPTALSYIDEMQGAADAFLLDTTFGGGSGRTHDWQLAARIARRLTAPIILAGGLTPGNVADAIIAMRPFAVDVESGVEVALPSAHGIVRAKDFEKVAAFVKACRGRDHLP